MADILDTMYNIFGQRVLGAGALSQLRIWSEWHWTNDWANYRDVGDLTHHCAHCGVTAIDNKMINHTTNQHLFTLLGPLLTWLTLTTVGISNDIHYKMWLKLLNPSPDLNGYCVACSLGYFSKRMTQLVPAMHDHQGLLLLILINLNHCRGPITCPVTCGMKSPIHSQNLHRWNFGVGE